MPVRTIPGGALVLAGVAVFFAACRPSAPVPTPTPDALPSPAAVVQAFYASYRGDYRQADKSLLSKTLGEAIASTIAIEQKSRAAIAAGPFPSDKPHLLEGEAFAGLYEGFTGSQTGDAKTNGASATVDVLFTNSHYAVGWTDRVQLVDEKGWKIDDIRYLDKKAGALGLRDVLRDFRDVAARDPLMNPSRR